MLAALIIVFREVFEAGLIVGIVMAVTRSVPLRGWWVSGGAAAGILGACIVAAFAGAISEMFAGSGQELFNAAVLGIAVVMLTWHNVWMARHGRELAAEMRAAGEAVAAGRSSLAALAIVVGVAVLREGSEVVLFLYGILATDGSSGASVFLGGVIGVALGALVCALTYFGLLRIPGRYLFAATSLIGPDELAERLIGSPDSITMPKMGSEIEVNGTAWQMTKNGNEIRVRAPMEGTVVGIGGPEAGWYLKMRPRLNPNDPVTLRHLLRGPEVPRSRTMSHTVASGTSSPRRMYPNASLWASSTSTRFWTPACCVLPFPRQTC